MAGKEDLQDYVLEALNAAGGELTIPKVAEHIWLNHEQELRGSGDLFYTWQYDMRWAANILRHKGLMMAAQDSPRGVWQLSAN